MGQCNFCTYAAMKRQHGAKNLTTKRVLEPTDDAEVDRQFQETFGTGVTVYDKRTGKSLAWFMELPDGCVC